MKPNRLTSLAWLLGVFVCFLFSIQMVLGQAEHLGFISCPEHQQSASTEGSSTTAEHCVCCQPLVNDVQSLTSAVLPQSIFITITDDRTIDGPVKAIDLPPQLS